MDTVLSRKLFRKTYFQKHKPQVQTGNGILSVQKFQTGGLSSKEKALLGLTVAGDLLKGTQRPGESILESTFRDLGTGLSKVPQTLIAASKLKKTTKGIRQATESEKRQLGFNPKDRVSVKIENGAIVGIADKPTAGEREKSAKRAGTFQSARTINFLLDKYDTPTGPIKGRIGRMSAYLGLNPEIARLDTELENFRKEAIAVLRGAQVGPLEEASFDAILPSITDRPDIVRAKMATAMSKLRSIEDRLGPGGVVDIELTAQDIAADPIYGSTVGNNPNIIYNPNLPTYALNGERIN